MPSILESIHNDHMLANNIWMNDTHSLLTIQMIFEYYGLNVNFNNSNFKDLMSQKWGDDDCILTFFLAITRVNPEWESYYEQIEKEVSERLGRRSTEYKS